MNRYPEQLFEEAVHIQYAVDSRIDECIYQIYESYRTKGKTKNPYINAITIVQGYNSRYEFWNDTDYSIYLELGKLNINVTIQYIYIYIAFIYLISPDCLPYAKFFRLIYETEKKETVILYGQERALWYRSPLLLLQMWDSIKVIKNTSSVKLPEEFTESLFTGLYGNGTICEKMTYLEGVNFNVFELYDISGDDTTKNNDKIVNIFVDHILSDIKDSIAQY